MCDCINLSDTVFLVDQLLLHNTFEAGIAFINVLDICNLSRQMSLQFFTFHTHSLYLVSHISDYKPKNKELCDPYISIIIQKNFKPASCIHLPEHISSHCTYCRKSCLLLSINDRKQKNIQKKRIQVRKISAAYCSVIHHKERNKTNQILHKRKQNTEQPFPLVPQDLPPWKFQFILIYKNSLVLLHIRCHFFNISVQITKSMYTVFFLESCSRQDTAADTSR